MTTLAQLADRAQNALSDAAAGTWSQNTVEEWVLDGIRDYNNHFTIVYQETINCTNNTRTYALPDTFRSVLLVEYPVGEYPPVYLQRRNVHHPDFWEEDGYYDIIIQPAPALTMPSGGISSSKLYISEKPSATEDIRVTYEGPHDDDLTSTDNLSLPPEHEPIVIAFVLWRACQERHNLEAQSPDTTIRMLHQFKLSAQAAEAAYREAIRAATNKTAPGGWVGPWQVDSHDRIY
jgi:hypothetical protein